MPEAPEASIEQTEAGFPHYQIEVDDEQAVAWLAGDGITYEFRDDEDEVQAIVSVDSQDYDTDYLLWKIGEEAAMESRRSPWRRALLGLSSMVALITIMVAMFIKGYPVLAWAVPYAAALLLSFDVLNQVQSAAKEPWRVQIDGPDIFGGQRDAGRGRAD